MTARMALHGRLELQNTHNEFELELTREHRGTHTQLHRTQTHPQLPLNISIFDTKKNAIVFQNRTQKISRSVRVIFRPENRSKIGSNSVK